MISVCLEFVVLSRYVKFWQWTILLLNVNAEFIRISSHKGRWLHYTTSAVLHMPPVQRASARRTQRHRNTWVRTETPPPPWAVITAWFFAHWKGNTPKCQAATKLKDVAPWKKRYDKPRQLIKKQRFYFANKDPYSQSCGFSSSQVWIWGLYHRESWALKNQCFWTVVLEKTLESPLNCKEIQPVHPKANQSWIFIGRTDAEAETPILWSPDAKWCWERLTAEWEGDDRRWDGWMASLTQRKWVSVNSGRWW